MSRSSRRSRSPPTITDVVEVRPEPGRAALEVRVEPGLERVRGRRLAVVAERRRRQPELARTLGEARLRARPARRRRASTSSRAELSEALRPRRERVASARARAARGGARRCAARAPPRTPAGAPRAPGGDGASTRSKYARRAAGPALHDGEAVGREDERRELAPQRLRGRQPRAVRARASFAGACATASPSTSCAHVAARDRERPTRAPSRRSGSAARRCACVARTPASRRGSPRAGSSCRRRSRRRRARCPGASPRSSDAYER